MIVMSFSNETQSLSHEVANRDSVVRQVSGGSLAEKSSDYHPARTWRISLCFMSIRERIPSSYLLNTIILLGGGRENRDARLVLSEHAGCNRVVNKVTNCYDVGDSYLVITRSAKVYHFRCFGYICGAYLCIT
jgi:hypothetical protein